jgi:hypothetical protein
MAVPVMRRIEVDRWVVVSSLPFEAVLARLQGEVGHPDVPRLFQAIAAARTPAEVERVVHDVAGFFGLMEMARFDHGAVVRKEPGKTSVKSVRVVVGNPLIMRQMVSRVPDAGSYAPVTVLVDQRSDGVYLSYDSVASFLAPYGDREALEVARHLDAKVMALLTSAAGD